MQASADIDQVTDAVLTASRVLVAVAARSLAAVSDEVTLPQYRALVVLVSQGPQSLQDLAGELDVVASTASRMCDRLVRADLVSRAAGTADRREVVITVSRAGEAIVAAVTRRRRALLRRIVQDMAPADRQALVSTLDAFSAAAGELPERGWYLGWP